MANITKIENKSGVSYKIRISCGYDSAGKKLTKAITFRPDMSLTAKQKENAVNKFALELEEKIKDGVYYDGTKTTFESFAQDWLERKKNEVSYNTYKTYEMMLRTKIIPYFRAMAITKIRLPMVEAFYITLVENSAQGTIRKYSMLLNTMFKTAVRWGMIEKNPCAEAVVPKAKIKTSGLKYFTPEQAKTFLASLDMDFEITYKGHDRTDDTGISYSVKDYVEKRGMPTQLKVFFYIAMTCGMRRGEILALNWADVDLTAKTIHITKSVSASPSGAACKEPKTPTSVRTIPIPDDIIPLLRKYRSEYNMYRLSLGDKWQGDGNMFIQADGKLMGMHTPYQRFVSHIERYNEWVENTNKTLPRGEKKLEPLPKIPFHGLRHTCATLLNDMGTNISIISKILGHAQTSTTMNIYAHCFESQLREASTNMNGFLRKCAEEDRQRNAG